MTLPSHLPLAAYRAHEYNANHMDSLAQAFFEAPDESASWVITHQADGTTWREYLVCCASQERLDAFHRALTAARVVGSVRDLGEEWNYDGLAHVLVRAAFTPSQSQTVTQP